MPEAEGPGVQRGLGKRVWPSVKPAELEGLEELGELNIKSPGCRSW